jgi:hypothetical protein
MALLSKPSQTILERLARIETRLVQLMLHLGLDPYNKTYDGDQPRKPQPKSEA